MRVSSAENLANKPTARGAVPPVVLGSRSIGSSPPRCASSMRRGRCAVDAHPGSAARLRDGHAHRAVANRARNSSPTSSTECSASRVPTRGGPRRRLGSRPACSRAGDIRRPESAPRCCAPAHRAGAYGPTRWSPEHFLALLLDNGFSTKPPLAHTQPSPLRARFAVQRVHAWTAANPRRRRLSARSITTRPPPCSRPLAPSPLLTTSTLEEESPSGSG